MSCSLTGLPCDARRSLDVNSLGTHSQVQTGSRPWENTPSVIDVPSLWPLMVSPTNKRLNDGCGFMNFSYLLFRGVLRVTGRAKLYKYKHLMRLSLCVLVNSLF